SSSSRMRRSMISSCSGVTDRPQRGQRSVDVMVLSLPALEGVPVAHAREVAKTPLVALRGGLPPAHTPPRRRRVHAVLHGLWIRPVPRPRWWEVRTPKRRLAVGDRRGMATHATGVRGAQLVDGLYARPEGWPIGAAAEALGVSVRSVERYVRACSEFITDD